MSGLLVDVTKHSPLAFLQVHHRTRTEAAMPDTDDGNDPTDF